ncbi:MAG TPA: metalloregulator ArsR/SmtB family transcription factor [Pseudolysinimonas sp.]
MAEAARVGAVRAGDPFDALADGNRREILRLLGEHERAVNELVAELPISRPAVSRHLRLLAESGLVTEQRRGTRRIFRLHEQGLQAVQEYLERVWGDAASRFTMLAENTAPGTNAAEPKAGEQPAEKPER